MKPFDRERTVPEPRALARRRFTARLGGCVCAAVLCTTVAHAEPTDGGAPRADVADRASPAPAPPPPTAQEREWRERYARAREDMMAGRFRDAQVQLRALASEAKSDQDRALALEMAKLAGAWADRSDVPAPAPSQPRASIRTSGELTMLYATSFLYGVGTGVWFLLQTQPESAATATLPFAALVATPIVAVATFDLVKKFPRGVPHALSAGMYLGLGQGIWVNGYASARARRVERTDPDTNLRWQPETVSSVLWAGATLGGVVGGALGSTLVTTPGRVSFVASTTLWSGVVTGLTATALSPRSPAGREASFLAGGVGYNAGIAGGLLFAGAVSPSVARVRLVDLSGVAGGLATTGFYLAFTRDVDPRLASGLAALGASAGLAAGWLLTSGMPDERPWNERKPQGLQLQPHVAPVVGGATLGVGGLL
ncbi:MAG: hypothetical protein KC657_18870 [Myxococcales bacterium]|nr:hypothetical protein [Myxococcales bacterium]